MINIFMIRLIFTSFLLFLLLLVKPVYAAEIVVGKWRTDFINEPVIPLKVAIAIDKYKIELADADKITTLKDKLESAILAQGYYDVIIDIHGDYLVVDLGKPYKIGKINYFLNNIAIKNDEEFSSLSKILAENIELTKKIYLNTTAKEHCIFNHHGDVRVDLDKKNKLLIINYYISGVENAKFGHIKIDTNNKISKKFIEEKLTFAEDQCYKFNRVDNSRFNLFKTGVFSDVKILQTQRHSAKYIDIDIETDIKNSKKLESMLEFSSEDKIASSFNFSNKNFRAKGEKLGLFARVSKKNKETKIEHKSANGLIANEIKYTVETSELQKEKLAKYSLNKTYKINNQNTIIAGVSVKHSNLLFDNKTRRVKAVIYALPLLYELKLKKKEDDYTNHALSLKFLTSKENKFFYNTGYRLQKYFKLFSQRKFFISIDTAIDKVHGKNIPLTEKTYLGGMNSIRGYKYETIGVLENNKNVPATSHYFLKTELSYHLNNNWGAGVFYDIGRLSNTKILKVNNMIDSTGLSVKYYINDLPISFDLAFPLKKKYSGKTKYEFYLNMGFNF